MPEWNLCLQGGCGLKVLKKTIQTQQVKSKWFFLLYLVASLHTEKLNVVFFSSAFQHDLNVFELEEN